MKATYLIYKQVDGIRQLAIATQEEWDGILEKNRQLPPEMRRCFINDCIEDEDGLDCMYIEVPASEHRKWNSKNTIRQRKRKAGKRYNHQSLDTGTSDSKAGALHESVPSNFDLEELVTDQILMEELKTALRKWNPWAEELLEFYFSGAKRTCTSDLCEKYQISDRTAQRWKNAFEKFVLDFLKN